MKLNPYHPLSQGLIKTFLFNEAGGNIVYDTTGHQNHGIGTNIAWGINGLDLPGINEHISISNFIEQDDDWTIFLVFNQDTRNPSSQTSNSIFVSMQDGDGSGKSIFYIDDLLTANYKLTSYIDGTISTADTVIDVGKEYSCGLTQNGTSFHFYLNGKDDGDFTKTATPANGNIILFDKKTAIGDGCFDGTIKVMHWYNRPLSATEMTWLDYDPYGMFEPDFIARVYSQILDETNIVSGKIIIKDYSTTLVDGLIILKDKKIDLFDGNVSILNAVTNDVDGKVQIQDDVINLVDGKAVVKDTAITLADGKVLVQDTATGTADGKVRVKDVTTGIVDSLIHIKDSITGFADGKVRIKDIVTDFIDGKIKIKNVTTGIIDGLVKIKNSITNFINGKIVIESVQIYEDINLTSTFDKTINLTSTFNKTINLTSEFDKTIDVISGFDFA